ncbi:SWIM zinc finger family protein [Pseudonocardia sp.]|uniref:SWIM zinc finger family protein n=1 Tax=Pseudonocardia sp. TaxID=60912 RepID=UPI00260727B2|nr:SWIM zinc finger family protein [Pseudonocardia sp.]
MADEPDPFWWREESARPRRVEGGIQISSTRGKVARTWWSGRFIAMLESLGIGGRLSRGRSYARAGQIVSLDVDAGGAVAQVQGSRPKPYRARIGIPAFGKAEWGAVTDALAADASYAAALLAGEMPREIEDVFDRAGLSLFPATARDLVMDCTCPDFAVPCKHLAAVFYVLAERFDADPFQILALRGRDRETLLDDLRTRRAAASPGGSGVAPLADVLDGFFTVGPGLGEQPAGPSIPSDALLDQVPEFPIAVRGGSVRDLLRPAYRAMGADDG